MTVTLRHDIIYLEDQCRVEDAEPLLSLLQENTGRAVDLSKAKHLHAAVVQLLLAFQPQIAGRAEEAFTSRYIEPLLTQKYHSKIST